MKENILKFGFFTDVHATALTPEGRTDNFRDSLMLKLEECGQIWENERVKEVWFGGDLFDGPDISKSIVNDVESRLLQWKKPIIGIIGSHDYTGYQITTLKRSALGLLVLPNIIELVGKVPWKEEDNIKIYSFPNSLKSLVLTGIAHSHDLIDNQKKFVPDYLKEFDRNENFIVQMIHADLVKDSVPWPHMLLENLHTPAHLILSGHIHSGWEEPIEFKKENTFPSIYFNPGSLSRLENTGKIRKPRVCIIEIDEEFNTNIKSIYLQSAKEHPFYEKIKEDKERITSRDITNLLRTFERRNIKIVDIKKDLPVLAKKLNYSDAVLERAFEFLEMVSDDKD